VIQRVDVDARVNVCLMRVCLVYVRNCFNISLHSYNLVFSELIFGRIVHILGYVTKSPHLAILVVPLTFAERADGDFYHCDVSVNCYTCHSHVTCPVACMLACIGNA